MREVLALHYNPVEPVIDEIHAGHAINTTFAYYRMKPPDEESDVEDLTVWLREQGDDKSADLLSHYLSRGDIRNVTRHGAQEDAIKEATKEEPEHDRTDESLFGE
jgi:hypothetical protein